MIEGLLVKGMCDCQGRWYTGMDEGGWARSEETVSAMHIEFVFSESDPSIKVPGEMEGFLLSNNGVFTEVA